MAMWSRAVKTRDGFKCAHCGSRNNLESHHIFSRRHAMTKYNIDNGITLCKYCHKNIEKNYEMKQWLINYIGRDKYDELDRLHYENKRWSADPVGLREVYEGLKGFIKGKELT
jgi:5-methylcytosine-specific restriction endonuclease McrA